MNVPVTVNGVTVEIPVEDAVIEAAIKTKKKTGYERFKIGDVYYYVQNNGQVAFGVDNDTPIDNERRDTANFYSSLTVAKANARADALMRQLRCFAAEHGGCVPAHKNGFEITYKREVQKLETYEAMFYSTFGAVRFSRREIADEAIEQYRDELLWYFTEYDPMPKGWWDD